MAIGRLTLLNLNQQLNINYLKRHLGVANQDQFSGVG